MTKPTLKIYISPCPNDTFIFEPLIQGRVECPYLFEVVLEDIETLNQRALDSDPDLIKVSAALYPQLKEKYHLLDAGGAMGKGVGPLLVGRQGCTDFRSVAIPGRHTTAGFLFDFLYPNHTGPIKEMLFSDIADAVLSGEVDAGVLIHEGRFTYHDQGLQLIADLGHLWEDQTDRPLPLGLIMLHKSWGTETAEQLTRAIQKSIAKSWDAYPELDSYVTSKAQELSPETIRQHIELYVNEYSLDLGTEGHQALHFLEKIERK